MRIAIIVVLSLLAASVAFSWQVAESKPYVTFAGAQSAIATRAYRKVTSAEDWAALWQEHRGIQAREGGYNWHYNEAGVPIVDFDRCMVVAVFQGKAWNSAGVIAVSVTEEKERILIRFDDKSYQTAGPDGGGERVTAYGLFVLPKTDKPVVLEEDVQGLIGEPPKWKERARL